MGVNYVGILFATRWLGMPQGQAVVLGAVLVVIGNFLMARFWIFVGTGERGRSPAQ
jgi:putative flippase GtrA